MRVWTLKDKAIGDYKFDKATKTWIFPIRRLVDIIERLHIEYNENTKAIYDELVKERQDYHRKVNLAQGIKTNPITVPKDGLYDHQYRSLLLGSLFGSYALFLEMGTGKSLIAIRLIEQWRVPTMIVAPLSTLESVWVQEFKKCQRKQR